MKGSSSCSVAGCLSLSKVRGLCGKHYQRLLKYGDPNFVKQVKGLTVSDRLEINKLEVQRNYESLCWEYKGNCTLEGYGRILLDGKYNCVHRLSWVLHNGEIPSGVLVCHKCDNPRCFNPKHLFLGTTKDNTQDRVSKGRSAKGSTGGNSKLTEDQVRFILTKKFKYGDAIKLAKELNVNISTIAMIIKRKTWRHIKL